MKRSIVLQTTARVLLPVMLLFSVYLLWRGHHEPGGGFVGGLLAASGIALYALAFDSARARSVLRIAPETLIGAGWVVALLSGCAAFVAGRGFMASLWLDVELPGGPILPLGTPVAFDVGVYLIVLGVASLFVFSLAEARR